MLFNSITFFIFLFIVVPLYLVLPHRLQNRMLLAASYIFYGWWDWRFCSLLIISTGVNFYCGIQIYKYLNEDRKARAWKLIAIIFNVTFLGFFKYYNFFTAELTDALNQMGVHWNLNSLHIILPLGISFYTFQTLSYSFDIYRRELKPAKNILDFALFISFFPNLLAGPIERAKNLIPQIIQKRNVSIEQFYRGCYLIFWGLFKKVCIADSIAVLVTPVFTQWQIGTYSWFDIAAAVILFAFQIYCDFSGYSDIARGVAKLMGFDLMLNFNLPYFSKSPSEFWHHWHISLSTWFRDYVYIPLGGSRPSGESSNKFIGRWIHSKWINPQILKNIMITFSLSGLWHGANWTFIVWGVYNGLLLIFHKVYTDLLGSCEFYKQWKQSRIYKIIATVVTFILFCYGWLIFKAEDMTQAWQMTMTLFKAGGTISAYFFLPLSNILNIIYLLISVCLLTIIQCFQYVKDDLMWMYNQRYWVIRGLFYFILIYLLINGAIYDGKKFIYFQF